MKPSSLKADRRHRSDDALKAMNRNSELLLNLPLSGQREASLLAAANEPLRLSPLLRAPLGEVVAAVRKLGLEGDPVGQPPQRGDPQIPDEGATNQLVAKFSRLYAQAAPRTSSPILDA